MLCGQKLIKGEGKVLKHAIPLTSLMLYYIPFVQQPRQQLADILLDTSS